MNANNRQVGGSHYSSQMQHWDFVVAAGLGYFEGQITKYVARHARKNGLQDLQKARHFAQKYAEVLRAEDGTTKCAALDAAEEFCAAHPTLGPYERAVITTLAQPCSYLELNQVEKWLALLSAEKYPAGAA